METLRNSGFFTTIEKITGIIWDEGQLKITICSNEEKQYTLFFQHIWDFRCATEHGFIDRFCRFRESLSPDIVDNGFYIVENSDYVEYFLRQGGMLLLLDDITDYLFSDKVDTVIEVLSSVEPQIIPEP